MARERRQITLPEDVERILAEQDNASAYLAALVEAADRSWRQAHAILRQAGWSGPALLAAMDALNGWWLVEQPATWAAVEMTDAQRLNNVCGKWEVDPAAWAALADRVRANEHEARALVELAAEFWRGNVLVERAIERE